MSVKRILLIDDDIELCKEMVESLRGAGYSADYVNDAIKGENLIRGERYDTILLDFKLPVLSGLDILKKLKADNIKKRIFIFSGRPLIEKAIKENDLSGIVSGIIMKPISFASLIKKLEES